MPERQQCCYINADSHDVTNLQEAIVFVIFLILILLIIWKVYINIQRINRMKQLDHREGLSILWRMNALIGTTLIFETLQKSEQLLTYILEQITHEPFTDSTTIRFTQIYYILTMIKIFVFYQTMLITSKLWFDLAKSTRQRNYNVFLQNLYTTIYPALPYALGAVYLLCIVFYLACIYEELRSWLIVFSSCLISASFLYSVTIFKHQVWPLDIIPKKFKFRLNVMIILMQISCVMRICWYTLRAVIPNQIDNIKAYNYETNTDESWGWFIYLLIYHPFVNIFPIFFLTVIFTPHTQVMPMKKSQSKQCSMTEIMIEQS